MLLPPPKTSLSRWYLFVFKKSEGNVSHRRYFPIGSTLQLFSPPVLFSLCYSPLALISPAAVVTDWPVNELFIGCKGNKLRFDVFPELSNESTDEVYHPLLLLFSLSMLYTQNKVWASAKAISVIHMHQRELCLCVLYTWVKMMKKCSLNSSHPM